MKKILYTLILFSISISVKSQLLWKITDSNHNKTSYLFATTPYVETAFVDKIPGIFNRFSACSMVLGETSINKIDTEEKVYNAALLPHRATLMNYFSETDKILIDNEIKNMLKLGLKDISAMKPAVIMNLYADELIKRTLLFENDSEINSLFQTLATEKGKMVEGVVRANEIITELSDTANLQQQADKLVWLIQNKEEFQKEILKLSALYKSGDIEKFYLKVFSSKFAYHIPNDNFLKSLEKTNLMWLKKINELCRNQNLFIITDITRLYGEKGLLQLLRKEGFKVTEIDK